MSENEGLIIEESEFKKLPTKQQNLIIYKNQREILKTVVRNRFHQKVQYITMTVITAAVIVLAKLHIK